MSLLVHRMSSRVVVCFFSVLYAVVFFFFFKQKTAYEMRISDWSSDVCSSDLRRFGTVAAVELHEDGAHHRLHARLALIQRLGNGAVAVACREQPQDGALGGTQAPQHPQVAGAVAGLGP